MKPLDLRRVICLDLETALIRPGLCSPPVSVCSIFVPGVGAKLYGTWQLQPIVEQWLDSDCIIIGHNIAYDMACLFEWYPALRSKIKKAYEANRILDTGLLWRIIEICKGDMRGGLALDRLCQMVGLAHQSKHSVDEDGDEIRLGFGKAWGTDLSQLTPEEVSYCQDDVVLCWKLFERVWNMGFATQEDLGKLGRTDLCLKFISGFGLRADPKIVAKLRAEAEETINELAAMACQNGPEPGLTFMRREKNKPNPVKTKKAYQIAIAKAFGIAWHYGEGRNRNVCYPDDPERYEALGLVTDTGAISTAKTVLSESGDELLIQLADLGEWQAVLNKDVKLFERGIFHSRFGFANTLRTTSSKPNIQNFRKKAGVRECIRPLWGAFVDSDYVGLENGTLAELIVRYTGRRGMADKISAGWDFHCEVGAQILGISYQDMVQRVASGDPIAIEARGAAKPLNFGLPGNMRKPRTFQSYARIGYGVKLTLEKAEALMQTWWAKMHDQMAYLDFIETFKDGCQWNDLYSVPIPGTSIIRRGCTSCAAANTGFQALGMQTAADALWLVVMDQLFGIMPGRLCAFGHDALMSDCKPEDIQQVRWMQERHMITAAELNLPNVKMAVETVAMDPWTKKFPKTFKKHNPDGTLNLYRSAA